MTASLERWSAILACLIALIGWMRNRTVLHHDALVLSGILIYFFVGTLNIELFADDWSPRLAVTQRVWLVVAVGVWGYLIGSWLGRVRARSRGESPVPPMARLVADSRMLEIVGWIGLIALLVIYRAPALSGTNREEESAYLTTTAELLIPAYLLRFAAAQAQVSRGVWLRAIAAGCALLVSGYRTYTLVLFLGLGVVWFIQPRSVWQRGRALVMALLVVLTVGIGFGYLRFSREGNDSGQILVESAIGASDASALKVAAGFTYVAFFREGPAILGFLVEEHPALVPYTHGSALWGMITSPLPGEQWDARAIISKEVYGARETSLVSSIFGPWYLDFGLPGVFVGLGLLGYLLSLVERGALLRINPLHLAAYAYGLVLVGLSIHSGISDFVFAILIPAVLIWANRSVRLTPALPPAEPHQAGEQHA